MIAAPTAGTGWKCLALAVLCAAGTWAYVARVLIPYQVADAAAHGRPRGNLSDLYPRWFGARELLLHGRDPYSGEITRGIQEGYYGHVIDAARSADPRDQQSFAYPAYVAFILAPTIHQSFAVVRQEAFWILLVVTVASVFMWLAGCEFLCLGQCAIAILTIGSLPVVQGLKLQQLTLLVAALIALAIWLLATDRPLAAGVALALATIKPQLVEVLLLWLAMWTLADLRRRYRWAVSFLVTLVALFTAAEVYLPHWLPRFLAAVREYRTYTDAASIFAKLIPVPWSALPLVLVAAVTAYVGWKMRGAQADTPEFAGTAAVMLTSTVVLIPSYGFYNQVLLLPALVCLARDRLALWQAGPVRRNLLLLVGTLLLWPWVASVILAAASFVMAPEHVEKYWAVPFWTALLFPVAVAALVLFAQFPAPFPARKPAGAS
jgi:hypothetical protein